jgi:hypothetical protein
VIEDRTPDELEALTNFYAQARYKYQVQVWHAGELRGTFLTVEKAQHAAEHIWKDQGYPEVRWVTISGLCANLEVQSLTDERWMTSNTFIRDVKVGEDDSFGLFLMGLKGSEVNV